MHWSQKQNVISHPIFIQFVGQHCHYLTSLTVINHYGDLYASCVNSIPLVKYLAIFTFTAKNFFRISNLLRPHPSAANWNCWWNSINAVWCFGTAGTELMRLVRFTFLYSYWWIYGYQQTYWSTMYIYIYIYIFGLTNHVGTAREGGRRRHDFVVIMRWRQGPIMPDTVHMVAKSEASNAVN